MATDAPLQPTDVRPAGPSTTDDTATDTVTQTATGGDGYTLVELLLVVAILGVLTTVVGLAVTGMTTEAADTGCAADRYQLHLAAEAFVAQTGNRSIPATGADHDRHERTLVHAGFLRTTSSYHDLTADGELTPEHQSC